MQYSTIAYLLFILLALLSIGLTTASSWEVNSVPYSSGAMARDVTAVLTGFAMVGCSVWCLNAKSHTMGAGNGGY